MKTSFAKKNRALKTGLASLLALSLPALAQDDGKLSGIPWGPVVAYPEVDLTLKSNDNIYSKPTAKQSANITILAPKIKLEAKTGPHKFDATYGVERGVYSNSTFNNFTDQSLGANAQWVFSGRSGLKLSAGYKLGHDDLGAVPGVATHSHPDKYHESKFNGTFGYGAEGSKGRIELEGGTTSKRYDNFKVTAAGLPDNTKRDRDDNKIGATFYWRIMPKTQLLFQATQTKYDYMQASAPAPNAGSQLDSTERNYLVGVTWDAAAKTQGIFKLGSVKKDFSDASLRDFSGTSWDATMKWSPLTYSSFDFNTGRSPGESTLGNGSMDTKYGAKWNHAWNSRLSSDVAYSNLKNIHEGSAGVAQTDKTNTLGLKLNYKWTRNFKIGAAYDRTDKTSTAATSEYKRNIYSIFLEAAI